MAEHFYRNAPEYRDAERRRRQRRERHFDAFVLLLILTALVTAVLLSDGCIYTEADMALERDRQARLHEAFDLVSAQYAVCQDALEAARRAATGPQPGPVAPLAPLEGHPIRAAVAHQLDARAVAAHDVR